MPRPRSLLIGLLVALVAFWAVAPMARAMLLLRDEQHSMANPPLIGGVQSVDASFYTSDSSNPIPISGWFVLKRPTAPTVILLPGWKADRTTMLPYASFLVRAGMNALLLDFRGSGHSGGSFSLGLNEPLDVAAAVSYLDTMGTLTNHHYGALGVSFGAGVAIAAAGNPLTSLPGTPELRAIVADSPWASENPTVDRLDRLPVLGLSLPLLPDAGWAVHLSLGGSLDDSSAVAAAAPLQAGQSLLLIRGGHDDNPTTTAADFQSIYAAAKPTKATVVTPWTAPLGGHAGAYAAQPAAYEAKVLAFFTRHLVALKDPKPVPSSSGYPDYTGRYRH